MTSKLYSILLLLICTITAQAQEYHVETPGTLQEVIGAGAEELTRIRVTGTLNDRDIAFLHYLCWPIATKPTDMKDESYLKIPRRDTPPLPNAQHSRNWLRLTFCP